VALSNQLTDNAHYVTYASAAGTVTVWGLHLSELAVMVSSSAALCGAVIQVLTYLDRRRGRGGEETNNHGETH
jgi:hypothetical protein